MEYFIDLNQGKIPWFTISVLLKRFLASLAIGFGRTAFCHEVFILNCVQKILPAEPFFEVVLRLRGLKARGATWEFHTMEEELSKKLVYLSSQGLLANHANTRRS